MALKTCRTQEFNPPSKDVFVARTDLATSSTTMSLPHSSVVGDKSKLIQTDLDTIVPIPNRLVIASVYSSG